MIPAPSRFAPSCLFWFQLPDNDTPSTPHHLRAPLPAVPATDIGPWTVCRQFDITNLSIIYPVAAMVPSPRKRAQPAHAAGFDQTWDHNDAAFLDPNTLPLAKIPRAWERRKDVKKLSQGKEKKIWRRFDLRSRASKPADEDDEEPDARSRAVKKLQHLSPKAMEKTANRKRAFKATRWDRRKSLLPRMLRYLDCTLPTLTVI